MPKSKTKKYCYEFPRPSVSADCVVMAYEEEQLKILLIQRGFEPFRGQWALPGGFVNIDEDLDVAASRELEEETGLGGISLEQFQTFGAVGRDPRGRVLTVAWLALVQMSRHKARAADDADDARWFSIAKLPKLAFDHRKIVKAAMRRLNERTRFQPIGLELLPSKFPISQLQNVYENVLGRPMDKGFQRRVLKTGLLVEVRKTGRAKAAGRQYRFDKRKYRALQKADVGIEIFPAS